MEFIKAINLPEKTSNNKDLPKKGSIKEKPKEKPEEIYISPENRQQIIDD